MNFRSRVFIFLGLSLCLFLILLSLFGPLFSGKSYFENDLILKNQPPSSTFLLGTDDLGRDIFTRLCYGLRISLLVGFSAGVLDLIFGVMWGAIAAFSGGRIDENMMRVADIIYSLPYLLVVILFTLPFGSGWFSIVLAIAIFGWITMARIVRGQILTLKEMEFVLAAKALGASKRRILFKHLIPNALPTILVTLMVTIPYSIFTEAFLSFLGLGVQAPMASLGTMASEGLPALIYYPWRLLFPALFITLIILSFNLIGEGLKENS
jgi:oligopeptide transport system permease protein